MRPQDTAMAMPKQRKAEWVTFSDENCEVDMRFKSEAQAIQDAADRCIEEGTDVYVAKVVKVVSQPSPVVEDLE